MEKISVEMFVKTYKAQVKGKDETFQEFIKKHVVNEYVDYLTKDAYCSKIVELSTHVQDGEHTIIKVNSTVRYMLFVMRLIELYTDIDINFEDAQFIKQYDELNKIGAIDTLISAIPEGEYTEFSMLLNMRMDDFRDNEYSVTAILYNLKQSLSLSNEIVDAVFKELENKKENID